MNSLVVSAVSVASAAAPSIAAGAVPPWPDAPGVDERLLELWGQYRAACAVARAASAAASAATERLPAWARSGPQYVDGNGMAAGDIVPWPAIEMSPGELARGRRQRLILVRPSPETIERDYIADIRHVDMRFGPKSEPTLRIMSLEKAAARRRRAERLLRIRQCRKSAEEKKLGLPALDEACDAAWERTNDLEAEIQGLRPVTPLIIAAIELIEIIHECDDGASSLEEPDCFLDSARRILDALRPYLHGAVGEEVAELFDNPSKPISEMTLWPHVRRSVDSSAVSEAA